MNCRVLALLYGNFDKLHARLLDSLKLRLPAAVPVTLWLNQVCPQTKKRIAAENGRYDVVDSTDNVHKYVAMRALFRRHDISRPDWWIWLDDDTWIFANDWYARTLAYISTHEHENICYLGQPWFVHHLPGQWEFIKKATWYRGRDPELIKGRPGVWFATGSYWWLRADVQQTLDWPDVRLGHNGGDTLLGEAIRQNGFPFHRFSYGVRPNFAPRRGYTEKPAGSIVDIRR